MYRCEQCLRVWRTHRVPYCPHCGVLVDTIPTQISLMAPMSIDVTVAIKFDSDNMPVLLIQKPSGQEWIPLDLEDPAGNWKDITN